MESKFNLEVIFTNFLIKKLKLKQESTKNFQKGNLFYLTFLSKKIFILS